MGETTEAMHKTTPLGNVYNSTKFAMLPDADVRSGWEGESASSTHSVQCTSDINEQLCCASTNRDNISLALCLMFSLSTESFYLLVTFTNR